MRWWRVIRSPGRPLILATATHHSFADRIAARFGIFAEVVATRETVNLRGKAKCEALCERFGRGGFDYAANAFTDLPVWQEAAEAILVNASPSLSKILTRRKISVGRVFRKRQETWRSFTRAIRVHQWAKNVLVFTPILL